MKVSEAEIERVVREVLSRLATSAPQTAGPATTHQLRLMKTVVTLADLEEQLTGIRELIVPPRAVITPAARDLLREQQIAVSYAAKNLKTASNSSLPLVIALADTKFCPAAFVKALKQHGIASERLAQTGLAQVTSELAEEVTKAGKLGLLFTDRPLAAACLANRHCGVRAAMVKDVRQAEQALAEIGVNLLVIEPQGRSFFDLVRIIRTFCSASVRTAPTELAQ